MHQAVSITNGLFCLSFSIFYFFSGFVSVTTSLNNPCLSSFTSCSLVGLAI